MMIRLASWRRIGRDENGVAATEFAILAPVLIMLYLGLVEICSAYMAQKRMGHVTSMVADLTAQEESVTTTKLGDIANIGSVIMLPYAGAPLTVRVSSVTRTAGVARVDWSWGKGMAPRKDKEVMTLPANLIVDGQSIIMSEAAYAYNSPINDLLPGITTFKAVYYLRPRVIDKVPCTNCPANP